MKLIIGALALAALAGCSTSPITSGQAASVPAARILAYQNPLKDGGALVITRDNGWLAGGGCFAAVLIDGRVAARVGTGETVRLNVPQGRHIIGMSGDASGGGLCAMQVGQPIKESAVDVKPHEVQKFRISGDTNGLDLRPTSL
ncbi:hypothetical protein [Pseudomonas sp. Z13]|uniref:hypothetical protein n=1 Tax=Pseudomonas sp. Z13 TaxID=2983409 RepID=UPI002E7FE751|nr:hypothetical protein [Pseudomonas sp. Z13]